MDRIRFGRSVRLLRQRRGWRQVDLSAQAGCSASAVSRLEHGQLAGLSVGMIGRVADALGASLDLRLAVAGGLIDRLHDSGHAAVVETIAGRLAARGWEVVPEASFSIFGERGSLDILAHHGATGHLLVVEVKTAIVDIQELLSGLDRKARLAHRIAADRGWTPSAVSLLLVVAASRANRRRIAEHSVLFDRALPARGAAAADILRKPGRPGTSGLLFISNVRHAAVRHRVRRPRCRVSVAAGGLRV